MDSAASQVDGGMMAALFISPDTIEDLIEEIGAHDKIVIANDNAPDQIVLSGENSMLARFAEVVQERNLGKTRKIVVAGPWHSPYIKEARVIFEEWAEPIHFNRPSVPLVMNASSHPEIHPTTIKHLVTWQLTSAVYFRESMDYLREHDVRILLEIGPGRVLSGLARLNGFKRDYKIYNVNNMRGVQTAIENLSNGADFSQLLGGGK